jgi:hypothetical protein
MFRNILGKTTVELPSAVNQYDARLEGKTSIGGAKAGRLVLLSLLQKVSLGELNPIEALEQFLILMTMEKGILDNIRTSGYLDEDCPTAPQAMRPLIHRYVFIASLLPLKTTSAGKLQLKRTHIANLLFMNHVDRTTVADCSEATLKEVCAPYFTKLQSEIIAHAI